MKFYKITSIATLLAIVFAVGCKESAFDKVVPQDPVESDFFNQEIDFHQAVLGTYANLTDFYWWNANVPIVPSYQLPDDQATTSASFSASGHGQSVAFEAFGPLRSDNLISQRVWEAAFKTIQRANTVLEKNENVEDGVYTTPGLKAAHRGEVLFLRGFCYFYLYNYFGKAPLVTKRISLQSEVVKPPVTIELLNQAANDFSEAATLLPQTWAADNLGRATKNSANGFLGKTLLFRGSYTGSTADYTAAIVAFNAISGVSLVPDWTDNFAFDAENNAESIFEFQASYAPNGNVWLFNDSGGNGDMSSANNAGYSNSGNGLGFAGQRIIATEKMMNFFDLNDPRTLLTVDTAVNSYRYVVKFTLREGTRDPRSSITTKNNHRIMRYAEILLLKAEAIIRSGGTASDAIGLINEVRTRARDFGGGAEPANMSTAETNGSTILGWIRDEKLRELAFEDAHRWFDLKRWHTLGDITLNGAFFDSDNASFDFNPAKHLVFPIPQTEISRNPQMTQNTGY